MKRIRDFLGFKNNEDKKNAGDKFRVEIQRPSTAEQWEQIAQQERPIPPGGRLYELQYPQELPRLSPQHPSTIQQLTEMSRDDRKQRFGGWQKGKASHFFFYPDNLVGSGGNALVYLADNQNYSADFPGSLVAKVLTGRPTDIDVMRHHMEALVLAKLSHPNIVKVFGIGLTEDDQLTIIMENLTAPGQMMSPLNQFIEELNNDIRVSFKQGDEARQLFLKKMDILFNIIYCVSSGLSYLHKEGVAHSDLKGGNILTNRDDGQSKIIDLGISNVVISEETDIISGTPAYMAPELVKKSENMGVSPASDIYSFALIIAELLTGKRARDLRLLSPSPALALMMVGEGTYIHVLDEIKFVLNELRVSSEGSSKVLRLFATALDPDPERRPKDAHSFAIELLKLLNTELALGYNLDNMN